MATPTLIQCTAGSSTLNAAGSAGLDLNDVYRIRLPNPSLPGNCLVALVKAESSATAAITATDDMGNTWAVGVKHIDTVNGATVHILYTVNAATGTREIRLKNTDATIAEFVMVRAAEFNNIVTSSNANALDGTGAGAHGSSSSAQAGSKTPGVSGDLLIMMVACDNGHASSYTAGSQANITWKLMDADRREGAATQWGVYTSTSAINPTMTLGSSVGWSTACLFLKSAAAGTALPSTMWVQGINHVSLPGAATSTPGATAITNPLTVQVPCYGNLLVAVLSSGSVNFRLTSLTDSTGGVWDQAGVGITNFTNPDPAHQDTCQIWYAQKHTPSAALTITMNFNDIVSDATVFFYDISGASEVQNDPEQTAAATGDEVTNITTLQTTTIVANRIGGIAIMNVQQETNTEVGTTDASILFDSCDFDGENTNGPSNTDQNGGWAHSYVTGFSPITVTWNMIISDSTGAWTGYAAVFNAPPRRTIYQREPIMQRGAD